MLSIRWILSVSVITESLGVVTMIVLDLVLGLNLGLGPVPLMSMEIMWHLHLHRISIIRIGSMVHRANLLWRTPFSHLQHQAPHETSRLAMLHGVLITELTDTLPLPHPLYLYLITMRDWISSSSIISTSMTAVVITVVHLKITTTTAAVIVAVF